MHVERLYIFSLIWSVGSLLKNEFDRNQFNALLLSITNVWVVKNMFQQEKNVFKVSETKLKQSDSNTFFGFLLIKFTLARIRPLLLCFQSQCYNKSVYLFSTIRCNAQKFYYVLRKFFFCMEIDQGPKSFHITSHCLNKYKAFQESIVIFSEVTWKL